MRAILTRDAFLSAGTGLNVRTIPSFQGDAGQRRVSRVRASHAFIRMTQEGCQPKRKKTGFSGMIRTLNGLGTDRRSAAEMNRIETYLRIIVTAVISVARMAAMMSNAAQVREDRPAWRASRSASAISRAVW